MKRQKQATRWLALAAMVAVVGAAVPGGAAPRAAGQGPVAAAPAAPAMARPAADWEDPLPGSAVPLWGDDVATPMLDLEFVFPYYGQEYTAVSLSANGVISLDAAAFVEYSNTPLPYPAFGALIAPFWDDLVLYPDSALYVVRGGEAPERWFTATWHRAGFYAAPEARVSFQATLREDGSVTVRFGAFEGLAPHHLAGATVGLQGPGGRRGLTYRWGPLGGEIAPMTAIDFGPAGGDKDGPEVLSVAVAPLLGGLYEVRARISDPDGAAIGGVQVWVEGLTESTEPVEMFGADGGLNGPEEEAVAYLNLSALAEGPYTVWVRASDSLGHPGPEGSTDLLLDRTAPVTDCALSQPDGRHGWYVTAAEVTCSATDALGTVVQTEYRLNGSDWAPLDGALVITEEGRHLLEVRSVDAAGNRELPRFFPLGVDSTEPEVVVEGIAPGDRVPHSAAIAVHVTVRDDLSGTAMPALVVDGEYELPVGVPAAFWKLPVGPHVLVATARDQAGHRAESEPVPFELYVDVYVLSDLLEVLAGEGYLAVRPAELESLRRTLRLAVQAVEAGQRFAARQHLLDFTEQLQDLRAGGQIAERAYQVLRADTHHVINHLPGSEDCGC